MASATNGGTRAHGRGGSHVFRDLLLVLAWRDITIKYKQSIMGLLWAVFMPTVIVGAGALVRIAMSQLSGRQLTPEDIASLVVKALPWAFTVAGLRFSTSSLAANLDLVTKINCP